MSRAPALVAVLVAAAALALAATRQAAGQEKKPAASATQIADLAWLEGSWRHAEGKDVFEEVWLPPGGDTMAAVSREVSGGSVHMVELSSIETTPQGLVLRIRHFGAGLAPWKSEAAATPTWALVSCADKEAAFEDAARDFPRRITYRREKDVLSARLEGTQGGHPADMTFRLERVSSK